MIFKYFSAPCVLFLIAVMNVSAQDTAEIDSAKKWKVNVLSNLTLTLNTFSDNWDGDEYSSFSWSAKFNGSAKRAPTSWLSNKNTLKLAFGQTAVQREDTTGEKEWQSLKKSIDQIEFDRQIDYDVRLRQTVGLALSYSFEN
ncbi:MAG: hypothetical protein ACLFVE_13570 [Chitinispirillaceae bacterium]